MASGKTLELKALETWRQRRHKYVPLRAKHGRTVEPRRIAMPGKPTARGSKVDIPAAIYGDDGRGIRRIG